MNNANKPGKKQKGKKSIAQAIVGTGSGKGYTQQEKLEMIAKVGRMSGTWARLVILRVIEGEDVLSAIRNVYK